MYADIDFIIICMATVMYIYILHFLIHRSDDSSFVLPKHVAAVDLLQ